MPEETKTAVKNGGGHNFGTFGGVFTPSILTIFGLIMFMRTGLVVGKTGVVMALGILFVSQLITFTTGLSISAISTNTPVKGGGAYFLISRALGPGFGSSIGLALFFAQSLSVPFYIIGFAEAMATNFPVLKDYFLWLAIIPGIAIFITSWVGANWAIKCQYVILGILSLSILAFLGGALFKPFSFATLQSNAWKLPDANIFVYFAIFFPAVTGIMAGVNMSGDLKDPGRAIPLGTLLAITVGGTVYAIQMILCGGAFSREQLINDPYGILVNNALFGASFLVIAGVVCATLSSALGSMLGAPRILQALARDRIIGILNPFGKGHGEHNEPRRAMIFSLIITMAVLIWGGLKGTGHKEGADPLNIIASVVTMFFLYTYAMVNLAAFVESLGGNPSFRPRFRYFSWPMSLLGALACIIVSFMINAWASLAALIIMFTLFAITRSRELKITFGDARRGFIYGRIRNLMLMLMKMPHDPKNWRPTIAVMTGNPNTRMTLLDYARLFECNRGILTLVEIIIHGSEADFGKVRENALTRLNEYIDKYQLPVFPEVLVTDNFDHGLNAFLQCHSLSPVKPNIVMMGWPRDIERVGPFFTHQRVILDMDMSSVIFVNPENRICPEYAHGRIDIWWRGHSNGSLMLILAHLLRINRSWERTRLRIIRTVKFAKQEQEAIQELRELVDAGRIDAEIKTIISDEYFDTMLRKISADAQLVFLGFRPPKDEGAEEFFSEVNKRLEGMPPTFMVSSAGEADLLA